jgi:hypothetical protein
LSARRFFEDLRVLYPLRPAVGGEHGPVERGVGVLKPRGVLVVEVSEGPLLLLRPVMFSCGISRLP